MYDDYLNDFVAGNAHEEEDEKCEDKEYDEISDTDLEIAMEDVTTAVDLDEFAELIDNGY